MGGTKNNNDKYSVEHHNQKEVRQKALSPRSRTSGISFAFLNDLDSKSDPRQGYVESTLRLMRGSCRLTPDFLAICQMTYIFPRSVCFFCEAFLAMFQQQPIQRLSLARIPMEFFDMLENQRVVGAQGVNQSGLSYLFCPIPYTRPWSLQISVTVATVHEAGKLLWRFQTSKKL